MIIVIILDPHCCHYLDHALTRTLFISLLLGPAHSEPMRHSLSNSVTL